MLGAIWFSTADSGRRYVEADLSMLAELARTLAVVKPVALDRLTPLLDG